MASHFKKSVKVLIANAVSKRELCPGPENAVVSPDLFKPQGLSASVVDPCQSKIIKYHFLKNCALYLLFHRGIPFLLNSLTPDLYNALTALLLKLRLMLLFEN